MCSSDLLGALGANDPANRGPFPADLTAVDADAAAFRSFVRGAVAARHEHPVLRSGALRVVHAEGPVLLLERSADPVGFEGAPLALGPGAARRLLVATNTGASPARAQVRIERATNVTRLDWEGITARAALGEGGEVTIELPQIGRAHV